MNGCRWTEPSYRTGYLKDNYPSSSGSSSSSGSGSIFESSSGSSDVSTQYTNIVVTATNDATPNFYDVLLGLSISNSTCSTVQRNYEIELMTNTTINAGIGNRVTQAGIEGTLSTAVAGEVTKIYINADNDQSFDGATELCIKNVVNVWTLSISPESMTHPVGTQVTQRMTHADSASGTLKVCSFHI